MISPLIDQLARLAARRASRRAVLASGASLAGAAALAAVAPRVAAQEATPAASPAADSSTLAHTDAEFLFVQVAPSATWAPKEDVDAVMGLTDDPCIVTGAQGVASIDKKAFAKLVTAEQWTL